jgi:hypothetical protein
MSWSKLAASCAALVGICALAACVGEQAPPIAADGGATLPGAAAGRSNSAFVASGNRGRDHSHTAVSSLGHSPGTDRVSNSSHYRLVGGLVATTQP